MAEQNRIFIGGTWTAPSTDDIVDVVSSHTEGPIGSVLAPHDVDRAVAGTGTDPGDVT